MLSPDMATTATDTDTATDTATDTDTEDTEDTTTERGWSYIEYSSQILQSFSKLDCLFNVSLSCS